MIGVGRSIQFTHFKIPAIHLDAKNACFLVEPSEMGNRQSDVAAEIEDSPRLRQNRRQVVPGKKSVSQDGTVRRSWTTVNGLTVEWSNAIPHEPVRCRRGFRLVKPPRRLNICERPAINISSSQTREHRFPYHHRHGMRFTITEGISHIHSSFGSDGLPSTPNDFATLRYAAPA